MNRTLDAARLHVVHPLVILVVPWTVVASSFVINEALWGFAHLGGQHDAGTGGVLALYITVAVVFLQSVTQLFPFAMSLGLSRRTFYAGTALMGVIQSLCYGLVLTGLTALENASGGWWVGLHFVAPYGLSEQPAATQFAVYSLVMLGMTFLGVAVGVVHKRWGAAGLYALAIGVLLLFGGASVLLTALHGWPDLGAWLDARSALSLAGVYAGVIVVLSAGLSYTGLRRAVP